MHRSPTPSAGPSVAAAAGLLLVLAIALRLRPLGVDGLWMDEVFGASFAQLGPIDLVVAVLRFDIHPPLYYLQLMLWALPAAGDHWLLLNSVAWSLATVFLAAHAVRSRAGPQAALVTLGLAALAGSEIYFAGELRMYAMLSLLVVAGWVLATRWVEAPGWRPTAGLLAVIAALSLLHSAAFVPISCLLLFALLGRWQRQGLAALRPWLGLAVAAAVLLAPWLANASMRSVSHTARPDLQVVAGTVAGWALGYGGLVFPAALKLGVAAVIAALVALGLLRARPQVRLLLLCFVVWPVLVQAGVSLLLRPIWLDRTLCYCAPFLAIAAGLCWPAGVQRRAAPPAWLRPSALVLAPLLAAGLALVSWQQGGLSRKMQYRELAADIAQSNAGRLAIHVPFNVSFWAMARYMIGPRWGSLLDVQDPVRADDSQAWARLYAKLGDARLRQLGLLPKQRSLPSPAGTLWVGATALPAEVTAAGYWKVGDPSLAGRADACQPAAVTRTLRRRGAVAVLCAPAAAAPPAAASGSTP